ncbi:hypothetical protein SD37_11655 [Amycolatopsis orientalis]|uniref:Uncharacterized protein n=1 Tax=Amycolatopsis orientalis TaxID=31958 RepID=A0A193BVN6_AMYOR|nr:hypothetical protein SD37_11655 [Amycolatopsis orientalis]
MFLADGFVPCGFAVSVVPPAAERVCQQLLYGVAGDVEVAAVAKKGQQNVVVLDLTERVQELVDVVDLPIIGVA